MKQDARFPYFPFYPADWQGNANLRRCSHEEKGIWIDIMCILHDQAEYGLVRWTLDDLAIAVGTTPKKMRSLIAKGVLKGADGGPIEEFSYTPRSGRKVGDPVAIVAAQDGPLWYSSRMAKDAYVRHRRAAGGAGGALECAPEATPKGVQHWPPKISPKATPKPPSGVALDVHPYVSETETEKKEIQSLRDCVERAFDALWRMWPDVARKRHPQAKVREAIRGQLKAGADPVSIIAAGAAHVAERTRDGKPELVKGLVPWLSSGLWRNWAPNGNGADAPPDWPRRFAYLRNNGSWPEQWGPPPGQPGYLGPPMDDLFTPEAPA